MTVKKMTVNNAIKVMMNILDLRDFRLVKDIIAGFDDVLDEFHFDDAFGTEGQNDPRGDHRP